jgi:polysaccharide export outer membrane protein
MLKNNKNSQNQWINQSQRIFAAILIFMAFALSGCYRYKNQILFQGLKDTTYTASMQQPKPIIQRGDQLSIMVYGLDDKTTAYFNAPMGGGQAGQMMMQQVGQGGGGMMGYIVNEEGTIEFPKLGTIKILGYTHEQLRDTLQNRLTPWIKDPIVNVRMLNFRVTFMTTTHAQTVFIMNQKTNILQFLGMVGGIQWTDRKDNILIIRQIDSVRQVIHVDFTNKEIFNSPVYYLQPNDIVYVEPNKLKFVESNVAVISLVTSITSTVSILVLFINNLVK